MLALGFRATKEAQKAQALPGKAQALPMQHQALPVLEDDDDAMAYLRQVRAEASGIPDIMVAKDAGVPRDSINKAPKTGSATFAVPVEWERSVLGDLTEARRLLEVYKARGVGSKRFPRVPVPAMKDNDAWKIFCDFQRPSVRVVLQFDAPMTQAILKHHISWAAEAELTTDAGNWIYALLAHLDLPLHRDVAALLRRLVARLLQLRANGGDLPLLQTLLVVAGRFFGQATPSELDGSEPFRDSHTLLTASGLSSSLAAAAAASDDDNEEEPEEPEEPRTPGDPNDDEDLLGNNATLSSMGIIFTAEESEENRSSPEFQRLRQALGVGETG